MILRRLMDAIREQNWFAVCIEFIIVILGVVVGFQVTAWNAQRADRVYERDLLNRLHVEIENIESSRTVYGQRAFAVRDMLHEARPALFGADPEAELAPLACQILALSYLISPAPDSLPSLDELVATGRMQSVQNPALRVAASDYLQMRETVRREVPSVIASVTNLPERYPELIETILIPDPHPTEADQDEWDSIFVCDDDAMSENPGFINAASQNIDANTWLANLHYEYIDTKLAALHTEVDLVLGLTHSEGEE